MTRSDTGASARTKTAATSSPGSAAAGRRAAVLAALVFLVALNLRPALTAVGPLLPRIGPQEHLDEGLQGLLGSLPLLAFAATSPLVHRLSTRLGPERSVLAALLVLAGGAVLRSYGGPPGLWAGTVVLGCAIAVGNVLVPALVKRDYPDHVSRATGAYTACITFAAALASAIAVPVAELVGWRASLAAWAVPAVLIAATWTLRLRSGPHPNPVPPDPVRPAAWDDARGPAASTVQTPASSVWRQPMAWLITAFMGLQSTAFYVVVTWLPTIETTAGISARVTGLHLFAFQVVAIVSALAIPRLMRSPGSQVAAALTASVPILAGVLGLLLVPKWGLVWAVVIGLGCGASLVVALTLISLRGRTHHETTRLSGMAQSLGYLLAAAGPVLTGVLAQHTGGWRVPLAALAVLAAAQVSVAIPAGRDRDVG